MSNELVCPFCQRKLEDQWVGQNVAHQYFDCPKCKMNGNPKLWQELIRTRKALGLALDWLGQVATPEKCDDDLCREFTERKLSEIKTALEQKDVK